MKNSKINFSRLLFEFVSISFAVLIALFVNQWREDHNNQKIAEKAIFNIQEELRENKEEMEGFIPYHKALLIQVDSLIIEVERNDTISAKTDELNVTLISSSAWEMAKVTKAVFYIEFDDVNNLAKVYDLQSYYEEIVKSYILYTPSNDHATSYLHELQNLQEFLETIIPLEESLFLYYGMLLESLFSNPNYK